MKAVIYIPTFSLPQQPHLHLHIRQLEYLLALFLRTYSDTAQPQELCPSTYLHTRFLFKAFLMIHLNKTGNKARLVQGMPGSIDNTYNFRVKNPLW